MAVGAIVARILTQYSDKGSKAAQKDIAKLGKRFDDFSARAVKSFGLAAAASAAFALKLGKDAVQAAIADQKSQALLANTLRNTTGATNEAIAGVETYVTRLQKQFSVVDDELRPAMARLVGVTGSITDAQKLMDIALNVSAKSGSDLATATGAVIKATSGQFKALKTLVPELSNTTIKSKDVAKAFEEVNKATAGAAATRAGTLEYRLKGLQIAFGEILETLGYALLPVVEKFAKILATDLLPKFELWVNLNKDKLAVGLQNAANFMLQLFAAAMTFGDWVTNNTETIKTFALILGSIWATSKVYAFAKAIGAVSLALRGMSLAALGSGAAGAAGLGAAAAGAIPLAIAAGIAALTFGLSKISPGEKARAKAKTAAGVLSNPAYMPMSPGASDVLNGIKASTTTGGTIPTTTDWLKKFTDQLKGATNATKAAKTLQDKINAEAVRLNLAKQAKLSGSSTIAVGGTGSLSYGKQSGTTVIVNNAGSVISQENLVTSIVNGIERTTRRSFGTVGAYDRL